MKDEPENANDEVSLKLAIFDQLIEQLARRCQGLIVSFSPLTSGGTCSSSRAVGNRLVTQGLLMDLTDLVRKNMRACDVPQMNADGSNDGGQD